MKICKNCKTENTENSLICNICKYPIGGTESEQAKFIAKQVMDKSDIKDAFRKLKKAREILFVVATYFIALSIYYFLRDEGISSTLTAIINFIIGVIFFIFAIISYKIPKTSLLIPLIITSTYYLLLLFISPLSLYIGALWKIIIVLGLGYGYFSVRKSDKVLKENKYLATLLGYSKVK